MAISPANAALDMNTHSPGCCGTTPTLQQDTKSGHGSALLLRILTRRRLLVGF